MPNLAEMIERPSVMAKKQPALGRKVRGVSEYLNIEHGFTLIELIVVVGIILILGSLLFAGMQAYRKQANIAKCVSNLKFFAAQSTLYSADNGGEILVFDKTGGYGWQRVLADYPGTNLNNYQKFVCPEYVEKLKGQGQKAPSPLTIWWTGYCGNRYFSDRSGIRGNEIDKATGKAFQNPGRIQQISSPSRTPQFFDNNAVDPSAGEAYAGWVADGKGPSFYAFWPAHPNGFNAAFFDGHVERIKYVGDSTNVDTGVTKGKGAIDYPQFVWKPY